MITLPKTMSSAQVWLKRLCTWKFKSHKVKTDDWYIASMYSSCVYGATVPLTVTPCLMTDFSCTHPQLSGLNELLRDIKKMAVIYYALVLVTEGCSCGMFMWTTGTLQAYCMLSWFCNNEVMWLILYTWLYLTFVMILSSLPYLHINIIINCVVGKVCLLYLNFPIYYWAPTICLYKRNWGFG